MLEFEQALDECLPFFNAVFAHLLLFYVQSKHRIVAIFLQLADSLPAVFLCKRYNQHLTYAIDEQSRVCFFLWNHSR